MTTCKQSLAIAVYQTITTATQNKTTAKKHDYSYIKLTIQKGA